MTAGDEKNNMGGVAEKDGSHCESEVSERNSLPNNEDIAESTDGLRRYLDSKFGEIVSLFNEKVADDSHKNSLFDNLHKEVIGLRNNEFQKPLITVLLEIIAVVDGLQSEGVEGSVREELVDVLFRAGVESFVVPDDVVDIKRQKVIKRVSTDKVGVENIVAERVKVGYTYFDKIIRPELIGVYRLSQ